MGDGLVTISDLGWMLGKCALNNGAFRLPPEKKDTFNAPRLTPTFVTAWGPFLLGHTCWLPDWPLGQVSELPCLSLPAGPSWFDSEG